ncbi:MAG: ABC transporter ATP-binding protein [Candidatus Hydrogenedentes bacterium]|nr:ABC transporter ATP-binding protein [Candidatus Hydrogenedentota bacterium]
MNSILSCQNIQKSYDDGNRKLEILRGVDLEVREGEILAISGPSGVGKSTLLHIMGTLDKPTSGDVLYQGRALSGLGRKEINRIRNEEIGFVFQFYHLLPEFTALENVMMPAICKGASRKTAATRAEELLHTVGLAERMTHKPGQLSGGEQQRVAIARALYNKPSVVLSDEPTGNLDENTGGSIIDLIWKLNEEHGVTLVIVTHDDSLAARAHRWIHMHGGLAELKKS